MTRKVILKDTNNEELIPYTSLATGAEAGRVRPDGSTIEVNANGVISVKQSGLTTKANVGLDNLSSGGQMIINSANGTISNCILEIPQNIKASIASNVITLASGSILTNTGSTYATTTTTADQTYTISGSLADGNYLLCSNGAAIQEPLPLTGTGSGSSLPADGSTFTYFYSATDKLIYKYADGSWSATTYCYPFCEITVSNGVASFAKESKGRDMIFNGAGFIGHHAFIYPNVKGLSAEEFNVDGSLKSNELTTNSLVIIEMLSGYNGIGGKRVIALTPNIVGSWAGYAEVSTIDDFVIYPWIRQYVRNLNGIYYVSGFNINTLAKGYGVCFIEYYYNGTTVTDFTIRQPYEGARYLLTDEIEEQIEQNTSDIANKQDTITGAATTITDNNLTANRSLTSNSNGKVDVATTTTTELNYVHGVTSAIQTQLNAKASTALDNLSSAGQMIIDSANATISNCILEIPQNIKLTLENNVLTLKSGSILTLANGSTYTTSTTNTDNTTTISNTRPNGVYIITVSSSGVFWDSNINITKSHSGSTAPENPVAHELWYNTTDQCLYNWSSLTNSWQMQSLSYPICLIEVKSGVASFAKDSNGNDMIFNGIGFIGHHVFEFPNIKGLRGIGINSDGSLASEVVSTDALYITEMTTGEAYTGYPRVIGLMTNNTSGYNNWRAYKEVNTYDNLEHKTYMRQYVRSENRIYVEKDATSFVYEWEQCKGTPLVDYLYNGTTVTDFTIHQPYEGARYLLTDEKADDSSVVHNTGDESIAGHKTFVNTIDYENASNTTNYKGRQYQQSSGDFIEGLQNKTNSSWLNYVQFKTDGSVKFSGTAFTIPTPTESTTNSTQADTVGARVTMLDALYPVGSVYIGTQATCPLATLIPNSTWQLQNSGLVLQCSDSNHTAGTTISAGLPNITGSFLGGDAEHWGQTATGAFTDTEVLTTKFAGGNSALLQGKTFDASQSNSIYGNSTTVQPPALVVNVWIRTA